VACVAGAGVFVTVQQMVGHTAAGGGWPTGFGTASDLAWAGVLFLGADAVCELTARIRNRRRVEAPHATAAPSPPGSA